MKKDLHNFIKSAKAEKLSVNEKGILRARILEFISFNPIRGKSPIIRERNYISIFEVRAFAKAGALLLIIAVVAGGSGVSYAAQSSLPGDTLYGIKVNVNEAIEEGLARTPTARVAVQSKKVERRLEEAQTLAKANKLSTVNQKIVIDQIEEHIKDLEKEIDILRKDGEVEVVLETTAKLTPVLEAHKEILEKNATSVNENVGENNGTENLIAKVEDGIKAVENEENATIAEVSGAEEETPAVATMAMMKVEDPDADAKRDAKKVIEEIEGDIKQIVKSRIDSAREKIRAIEETQAEIKALDDATVIPAPVEEITAPTAPVKDLKTAIVPEKESVVETEVAPAITKVTPPVDDFNIESRLRLANDLLKEANRMVNEEEWPEALSLAQEVNRIAAEIETHIHLKEIELSKATDKNEDTASVIESLR